MSSAFVVRRSEIPAASSRKIATCSLNVRKRAAAPAKGWLPRMEISSPSASEVVADASASRTSRACRIEVLDVSSVVDAFSIEVTTAAGRRRQVVERLGELGLFGRQPLIEVPRRDRGADERQRDQTGEHDADDSEHEHGRAGTALVHSEQRHRRMVARAKPLTPFRSAWYYVRRYIN